jgi:hypothetical protein
MISQDIRYSRLKGHLNQVARRPVRLAGEIEPILSTQSEEGTLDNYSRQSVLPPTRPTHYQVAVLAHIFIFPRNRSLKSEV